MGYWKWFNTVLKDAGVEVTDKSKEKVDKVIHQYISEQASYGKCPPQWSKAKKQILENEQMKKELMQKLKALA